MKKTLTAIAACLLLGPLAFCQEALPGTGLETGGDLRVRVAVDDLTADARTIGMDGEALGLRCAKLLESYGIAVVAAGEEGAETVPELHLSLSVQGYSFGAAVELRRPVSYGSGSARYSIVAPVWRQVFEGGRVQQITYTALEFPPWRGRSHEPGARIGHAAYVRDELLALVERFCKAFLAANPG
jgi:hypothetical protein